MIARFAAEPLPAIIPIPGASGANGFGMRAVRAIVEKAVGVDILLGKKGKSEPMRQESLRRSPAR